MIGGEVKVFPSRDRADSDEATNCVEYPEEFLHSLNASGLPPHSLKLKQGVSVMLLRNLSVSQGLVNGTRLVVKAMQSKVLQCEIVSGDKAGQTVLIPGITCESTEGTFPFKLIRQQFPLKLCFSMTVNKSQGSTFDMVGINLQQEVFSHGMLYVAMCRVRSWDSLKVLLSEDKQVLGVAKNVVWKDALL